MIQVSENTKTVFSFLIFLALIGGCYFLPKHETVYKNENWCAEFAYYNPQKHKLDTAYSNVIMFDDSVVSITSPLGKTWLSKQFLNNEEIEDNYFSHDVTVENGDHFKFGLIMDSLCGSKIDMDSLNYNVGNNMHN